MPGGEIKIAMKFVVTGRLGVAAGSEKGRRAQRVKRRYVEEDTP